MDYDFPETVGNFIIPTDEVIFFRGVGLKPPVNAFFGSAVQYTTIFGRGTSLELSPNGQAQGSQGGCWINGYQTVHKVVPPFPPP